MGLVWFYFPLQSTLKINLVFDQLSNPFWALCPGFPNWIKELGALRSHLCWALGVGTKSSWSGWHALELLKGVACTWAPERSLYSLLWLPCCSSGDGKVWRVCSCVVLLSSKTFPFSPSFLPPTASWSLHVLKLLAPWHCPLRNREGYLGTKPSWLRFLSPSALRWPGVACSILHGFCQTLVSPLEKRLSNGWVIFAHWILHLLSEANSLQMVLYWEECRGQAVGPCVPPVVGGGMCFYDLGSVRIDVNGED